MQESDRLTELLRQTTLRSIADLTLFEVYNIWPDMTQPWRWTPGWGTGLQSLTRLAVHSTEHGVFNLPYRPDFVEGIPAEVQVLELTSAFSLFPRGQGRVLQICECLANLRVLHVNIVLDEFELLSKADTLADIVQIGSDLSGDLEGSVFTLEMGMAAKDVLGLCLSDELRCLTLEFPEGNLTITVL